LGIKQLEDDPYAIAVSNTKKGDVVFAKVTNVQMSGLDVKLENGLIGFIKKGEVSNDKFTQKTDVFTEGEEIEAIVLGIDRSRSVNLSIRILEAQREKEALKKFGDSGESNTSIGNIIEAAISAKEEEKNNQ
jgi:small subunit ribosomal protein S1